MGNQKNKTVRMIMRTMAVLVAGIMISVAFLANIDTYSWFIGSAGGSAQVTAAETDDIIETMELVYDYVDPDTGEGYNPVALKLKKVSDFNQEPLIFFSVEDKAAEYVLHINPVRLDTNGIYIIPIETDVNANQYAVLFNMEMPTVDGKIRIKYMNEYIDESLDISFTKEFLINRLMAGIVREDVQIQEYQSEAAMMRFATAVEAPARTISMYTDEKNSKHRIEDITVRAIELLAEQLSWQKTDVVSEDGKLTDEALFSIGLKLTSDQELLMDIIYPGLKEYVEELKNYIGRLKAEIEGKNAELADLDVKLASLEIQYNQLLEENARLTEQINSMTLVPPPVQPPAQPPVTPGGDTTQPPASGGGSAGGGTGAPGGSTPDEGATPDNGTPSGDTGSGPGDVQTGDGSTGTGDNTTGGDTGGNTGDGTTGDQNGSGPVNEPGASTGEDGQSGDVDNGSQDEEPGAETGGSDVTDPGQSEDVDTGDTSEGPQDNGNAPENPADSSNQDVIVGGSDEEDDTDGTTEDSEDASDTTGQDETGGSDSTDEGSEITGPISNE